MEEGLETANEMRKRWHPCLKKIIHVAGDKGEKTPPGRWLIRLRDIIEHFQVFRWEMAKHYAPGTPVETSPVLRMTLLSANICRKDHIFLCGFKTLGVVLIFTVSVINSMSVREPIYILHDQSVNKNIAGANTRWSALRGVFITCSVNTVVSSREDVSDHSK